MKSCLLFIGTLLYVGILKINGQVVALNKVDSIATLPDSYITRIEKKYTDLDQKLTGQTEKYLSRLEKAEQKIQRKLNKVQGNVMRPLQKTQGFYSQLMAKVQSVSTTDFPTPKGMYLPLVDSVNGSLAFLSQQQTLLNGSTQVNEKISASIGALKQLQARLQVSDEVKSFIAQRKEQMRLSLDQLQNTAGKFTKLPAGLTKDWKDFQQKAYYYNAQVAEYKALLNTPDRLIEKGLGLLRKLPAFQQFMKTHGELAGLFTIPADYGAPGNIGGLQTRAGTQQLIQSQLSAAGPNSTQILQQNLQAAQVKLSSFKDKLQKLGTNSADMELPDFKPNGQKTKAFWKRFEYGTNLQTAKNNFFPITTDVGLSVGYKLNDKSTIGIGASYKMGWGKDIKHIHITNQGIGFRSFIDVKLKGSFYASGGLEYNYQPLHNDSTISIHTDAFYNWQKSGLVGISKMVSIKSRFFKKTKLQLLFDFLSYQAVPRTQPIKFRVGYNIK
ncbi:hypothetical protein A4H97_29710 [Niastella yeongjuensis]|uniref:Uncharacterized protein n=1 Tax=Niastella yeongjuensis TaxID=354355 RepID=A0A1V9EPG3_9BACT|nr:hypothetical protein [Niastella yeongjuensis]OQP48017.1 hypothetical protein A4H97_29710 [Niastella yeongjuensis]SEO23620.1 hypothetical protein SAMN05660816_02341 [Niastella yeongjuensis]